MPDTSLAGKSGEGYFMFLARLEAFVFLAGDYGVIFRGLFEFRFQLLLRTTF